MTQINLLHRASVPFIHLHGSRSLIRDLDESISPVREIAGTRNILPPLTLTY